MEAVQVCPGGLEIAHPFLGLRNHHVAVEHASAHGRGRRRRKHVGADFGHDRRAEGYVGDEVAVPGQESRLGLARSSKPGEPGAKGRGEGPAPAHGHYVDVEPICAVRHGSCAFAA